MENYKIIYDEEELDRFINFLPNLKENERYYWSLFARRKYCNALIKSNDKTQLKRGLATKENLKDKIKQLEIEVGRWKLREVPAPQESLVFYLMPNPRCMRKATFKMIKQCADLLENTNKGYNLQQEAMSCIQKSKSRRYFVDFDIDSKEVNLNLIKDILPDNFYSIIETRGGYHILVNVNMMNLFGGGVDKKWYNRIKETFTVDQTQDQLVPVPGTIQGGFEVKFLKI